MNPPTNVSAESSIESTTIATAAVPPTQRFFWSVRRELWENRSVYIAPLVVSGVMLLAFFFSTLTLPGRVRAAATAAKQRSAISMPFDAAAGVPVAVAFLVGVFYCLDALYGERRDRSILFWKSLPVSDRTTVLAKASIPLVVLPLIVFTVVIVTHLVLLVMTTVVLQSNGMNAATLLAPVKLFQRQLAFLYALIAIALWHAPIYAWMLLVSGWARRAPILWAILPPVALAVFETIAFRTSHLAALSGYRVYGWFQLAFVHPEKGSSPADPLASLTPGRFLSSPGLWIGVVLAAAFLVAAVRMRRYREPI